VWGGGGGGIAGAVELAATAIVCGQAETVAVYRALAERDGGRQREDVSRGHLTLQYLVNGVYTPAQICALRTQRLLDDGLDPETLLSVARAAYYHARNNPAAYGRDADFDDAVYRRSRWVSEPLRLFDCSRENDGAVALVLTSADRARHLVERPAYVLAARCGAADGWGEIEESVTPYSSSGFGLVSRRLWSESGYGPADVDVVQAYENFTGPAVAALIDHGFCDVQSAAKLLTFDNLIAPGGDLPLNTAGGNLAEGFVHGMGLAAEAVRQLQGRSSNQVPDAALSLLIGGPGSPQTSSALFGSAETL
jgi:acetyl-CoA acetyltransferase